MWRAYRGNQRKAFRAIACLRNERSFERHHLEALKTLQDRDLIYEIGSRQSERRPLTMKQAFLLELGSVATVQRRLRRLRQLGLVQQRRSTRDRRVQELRLSAKVLGVFARYDDVLRSGDRAHKG